MSDNHDDDKTQSFTPLIKNTNVGHYRIIEKIGAGGMGEVYLAEDTKLKRQVALKFLPYHFLSDETAKARFRREAQAAAKLNHPNIVTIYEVSEYMNRPFFAMECCDGKPLRDVIKEKELSIDESINLTIQICEGLEKAHQAGIVHRDIKPSNIVIDSDGRPKLLDFGLATVQGTEKLTQTGSTLGTIGYMSPEQIEVKEIDHRSDLFSLGVVLYEMITGRLPFKGDTEAGTLNSILNDTPEPLSRYKSNVPDQLQQIVTKLLEKNPAYRYQSAAGVLSDLKRLSSVTLPARKGNLGLWIATAAVIIVAGYFLVNNFLITDRAKNVAGDNSIAVLIFRDQSPNKDQEYFCEGMTDAIIGRLSGIQNLKVVSLTSVLRFKDTDRDLKKIGKELGVETILEGSIQKERDRIRIRAQLIDVSEDAHLWSDQFDQKLESVFDVQDDISRAIVDAMKIKLFGEDTTIFAHRYTENIEAYNFYVRGRHLWNKRTEQDIKKAIEHFESAIELDPYYALAYSGLADAWAILPDYLDVPGAVTRTGANVKAREAAEMAVELDENLAEAHTSQGLIHSYENNWAESEKEFLRAIELNPGYFWAHYWYSMVLEDMARYPEQIRENEIAFELNPMSIPLITNRAYRKKLNFEWKEAEELYKRLIEIEPNRRYSYTEYAIFLAICMGRNEDAIRQCSLAVEVDKNAYNNMAYMYEWIGDFEKALWAANMYIESAQYKYDAYDTRGKIFMLSGKLDSAEVWFKKALELKPDYVTSLRRLGRVYMFKQEYAKAESLYQIIASHPDKDIRASGRLLLTQIPLYQGKLKEGLRMLDELKDKAIAESITTQSWMGSGFYRKGLIYEELLNDQKSSTVEYEKTIETLKDIYPNSNLVANSRANIAYNFAKEGNFDKANQLLKELEQDIDRYGPSALNDYLIAVAGIEEEKGNYDIARTYWEKIYKVSPVFYVSKYIGINYLKAGRPANAIKVFERIINRYESNRSAFPGLSVLAHYYLGQAYEETGRYDEAIEQYETFLDIWKNADDGIEAIDDAKERLAKLKSSS
ncbi:MAG: protein kinase [candidate division Zixibacteria bacterium]|nr:protein kinase [candidate division Zixibacteria bacterium]